MGGRTYPVLSRRKIEGLIAEGRSIFIVNQYVLKADPWLKYHPGGEKAILHMVGRDATDEVTAFVPPYPIYHYAITLTHPSYQSPFYRSTTADESVSHWKD